MMRIGRESFGEPRRTRTPVDALPEEASANEFDGDEITLNTPEKELKGIKRSWHDLILGVRDQYRKVKEALVARTDVTLGKVADTYTEKYLAERNPKTGESPQTVMRKFTRSCEAAYTAVGPQAALELGIRAALQPLEFSAQMAMKQFGVDIAVRQADYEATVKKYDAHGGVKTVESQATEFANTVRERFERLGKLHSEMPGDTPEERESFRQSKIAEGVAHAQEVLARFSSIDDHTKQRIMAELHTHLDTVVFDTHKPSLMRKWEALTSRYSRDITSLVTKHIDVYQKKQSRNLALLTTASRWMTLGTETYLIQRGLSATRALGDNYTKELKAMPAEKRTGVERMRAFGRATMEGLVQLSGFDRYRELRKVEAGMQSRIDEIVQNLLPPKDENLPDADFPVDEIEHDMWERYGAQLTASGVDRAWLYDKIEDIAGYEKNRRQALVELIQYRIEGLHRQYLKAATAHVEHVYNQYNANITAVNMLAHIDVAVNEGMRVRDAIGTTLEHMTGNTVEIAIPTTGLELKDKLDEPQYHAVMAIVQDVEHAVDGLRHEQETTHIDTTDQHAEAQHVPQPLGPEIAPEDMPLPVEVHAIAEHETLWGLATSHLEAYREREDNPEMTVHDVLQVIAAENHIEVKGTLHIGQELELAPLTPSMAHAAEWRNELSSEPGLPHTDYAALARQVDSGGAVEGFVANAGREDLAHLPEGNYTIVVGERYTASGGRMPIHYGDQYTVTVVSENDIRVVPEGHPDQAVSLDQFLVLHQDPIVRVFSNEGEVQVEHEALHPEQWSQHNQALMHFLQDHPISVESRKGAYCARDVAGRYNLFGHDLAADVGMSFRDQNGELVGMVSHAPLVASSIEGNGGHEVASLMDNFNVSDGKVMPFERLSSDDPAYRAEVQTWIHAAGESPLGVATFFYDHTKIQSEIARNMEYGGEANSHVVLLLGEKDLAFSPHKDMTLEHAMEKQFKMSQDDMDQRGWMFETLGIEVNGVQVTSEADWQQIHVGPADHVVVHDISINHRYHTDRADTLVELMVNDGALNPVSVIEPSAELLNDTLSYHGNGGDYAIDTFHQVQKGETFGDLLAKEHYPRDLWTAATFAMKAEGHDPANLKPGELVPLYSPAELRAHMDDIYATEEHRLTNSDTEVVHIVRPGETMDELAGSLFDRSHYSSKEWAQIKERVATLAGSEHGVASQDVEMPGNEYVEPYHMTQYTIHADAQIHFSRENLAAMDQKIIDTRLSERIYLPDALPVYTKDGVVMEHLPANIRAAIDRTVDAHPEYGESMREELALVYVNEGMREGAEKNPLSQAIEEFDKTEVQPALQVVDIVSQLMHSSAGKDFAQEVSAVRDSLIGVSEYASSRQMLKDIAWWIHDTPAARAVLDQAIAKAHSGDARTAVVDYVSQEFGHGVSREFVDATVGAWVQQESEKLADKMETVRDVQSAGPFQFRPENIISEDGSRNMSDTMLGRHFDTQEQLGLALRTNVQVGVDAAGAQLYQNRLALETYAHAADDKSVNDPQALLLAVVNSYNGGPYKTLLGGLQYDMMQLASTEGITIGIDTATGRGTPETRDAFIALCHGMVDKGDIQLSDYQIERDAALLGDHTIGFLHSDSFIALRQIAEQKDGQAMRVLPTTDILKSENVSYGNYAFLAGRGKADEVIQDFSQRARVALGDSVIPDYSARPATSEEAAITRG